MLVSVIMSTKLCAFNIPFLIPNSEGYTLKEKQNVFCERTWWVSAPYLLTDGWYLLTIDTLTEVIILVCMIITQLPSFILTP